MIGKYVSNLKTRNAVSSNDISTKMLKDFEGLFVTLIYSNYLMSLPDGSLSEDLKTAEVVPVYKEKERTDKNYYRPASILSNISKNCERSICNQMYGYFDRISSKHQCEFRKRHGLWYCLLYMIEKMNKK